MNKAIILFGHGSRDPLWRLPMETVAARLRALQPELPVRCAGHEDGISIVVPYEIPIAHRRCHE